MSQNIPSQIYEAIKMEDRKEITLPLGVVQEIIKKGQPRKLK